MARYVRYVAREWQGPQRLWGFGEGGVLVDKVIGKDKYERLLKSLCGIVEQALSWEFGDLEGPCDPGGWFQCPRAQPSLTRHRIPHLHAEGGGSLFPSCQGPVEPESLLHPLQGGCLKVCPALTTPHTAGGRECPQSNLRCCTAVRRCLPAAPLRISPLDLPSKIHLHSA